MRIDVMRNRLATALVALASTVAFAACGDGSTGVDDEPRVTLMRLTIGTETINVNAATGAVSGGSITIARNGTVNVSAQFLRSDGTPDPLVTATAFQLSVEAENPGILTFTRSGSFTGTLEGVGPGSSAVTFGLFHVAEDHNDFQWPVPITVTF